MRGLVCEADGVVLAAGYEDCAVWEDDAVVEGAGVGHWCDGGDGGGRVGVGEGDYVGVGGGVGVCFGGRGKGLVRALGSLLMGGVGLWLGVWKGAGRLGGV